MSSTVYVIQQYNYEFGDHFSTPTNKKNTKDKVFTSEVVSPPRKRGRPSLKSKAEEKVQSCVNESSGGESTDIEDTVTATR